MSYPLYGSLDIFSTNLWFIIISLSCWCWEGGDNLQKSWHFSGVETLRPLPFDSLMAFWHWERQTEANVSTKTFFFSNNLREQIRFHEHLIKLMGVVRFANHVSEMRWNVWQHIRKERDIIYNCISSLELLHHFWRLSCIQQIHQTQMSLLHSNLWILWWHFSC